MSNKIDEIMDNFDFDKVHSVMHFLNWVWYFDKEPPTIERIMDVARRKLQETLADKQGHHSGGFKTEYINDGDLSLSFVVTDWDTLY